MSLKCPCIVLYNIIPCIKYSMHQVVNTMDLKVFKAIQYPWLVRYSSGRSCV